jgi:hypothetical protein
MDPIIKEHFSNEAKRVLEQFSKGKICPRTLQLIIVGFQNLSGKDKWDSELVMEG